MRLDYRRQVLAIAVAANFAQFGSRVAISPLVPDVMAAYGVTKSTVGLLLTAMWAVFALLQFPSGVLADRYGERRVILAALAATAAFSLGLFLAPSFPAFAVAAVLLGGGAGLYFSVGSSLLASLYERRGTPLSVHSAGGPIAGAVVPAVVTAIALRAGWQEGFLLTAAIAGVVFALVALRVRPTEPADPDRSLRTAFDPGLLRGLLSRREVATTLALSIVGMFVFQSFLSFYPTFLEEHWRLAGQTASRVFGGTFALFAVSLPLQGRLADRIERDVVLVGAFASTAAGFALVAFAPTVEVALAGTVVLGLGVGWGGVLQARFMAAFDASERGTGFGLVRTVFILIGSSGNAVTGFLAERAGWEVAYGLVACLLVVSILVVLLDRATRADAGRGAAGAG